VYGAHLAIIENDVAGFIAPDYLSLGSDLEGLLVGLSARDLEGSATDFQPTLRDDCSIHGIPFNTRDQRSGKRNAKGDHFAGPSRTRYDETSFFMRFSFLLLLPAGIAGTAGALLFSVLPLGACSSTAATDRFSDDDGAVRKDGGAVVPSEAGAYDAASPLGPDPECGAYCDLVLASCKDTHAQYASRAECIEICGKLPLGDAGDTTSDSIACREHYAGGPAQTDPVSYCLAAGPFGGGLCGDRCAIFCELAVSACSPDAGAAPFDSYPDCQTACAGFAYVGDEDGGGGEGPDGPDAGDTLNCRLFELRSAVHDGSGCPNLGADSGACR
jgi:hypothetical protein